MIKEYLKIALRQIKVHKIYSVINITGLSIGLAASFIILLYVFYQISFDKYNEKLDDIYLITAESKSSGWVEPFTPVQFATTLKSEIPEIKEAARWATRRSIIKYGEKKFEEGRVVFSDLDLFKILTLPLEAGDLSSLSKERDYLIISESMREKYFSNKNPIGEILSVTLSGIKFDLKVSAIMKDIPKTSSFYTNFIAPWHLLEGEITKTWKSVEADPLSSWNIKPIITYILLNPDANREDCEKKLSRISENHLNVSFKCYYHLFPVKDIYFHSSKMVNSRFPTGSISNVYIYSSAAVLILFIACVNYLMLGLGRASLRTKEIGIRKVSGATKYNLFKQVTTEAIITTLIALPFAVMLVQLLLPDLSQLLGIKIDNSYFYNWVYIIIFILLTLLIGSISGSYISFYLSAFNPVDIIKNKLSKSSEKTIFRRILIVTQMTIFIGLCFASVTIYKQLKYFINKDFGFNKDQLIALYPKADSFSEKFEVFGNILKSNADILAVSASSSMPGTEGRAIQIVPRKENPSQMIPLEWLVTDKDFIETMEMRVIAGSSLKNSLPPINEGTENEAGDCLINESAVREFGFKNPIGEMIRNFRIVGVIQDFNMHSLREKIGPLAISIGTKYRNEVVARLKAGNIPSTLKFIKEKSKEFNEGEPMLTSFFDERLDDMYFKEHDFFKVISYATGVAIFVACLGLFGISLFVSQQKVKEIGIRKVLGASLMDIYVMLTREFLILAVLSMIIAFPLSYYFIEKWLQSFEYRIDINMDIFILSALMGMIIVCFTVSIKSLQSALSNPVNSIKCE